MTKEQAMEAYIKETRRVNQNFIYIVMFNTIYNRCLFQILLILGSYNGTKK